MWSIWGLLTRAGNCATIFCDVLYACVCCLPVFVRVRIDAVLPAFLSICICPPLLFTPPIFFLLDYYCVYNMPATSIHFLYIHFLSSAVSLTLISSIFLLSKKCSQFSRCSPKIFCMLCDSRFVAFISIYF